jgi:hypothetical protein
MRRWLRRLWRKRLAPWGAYWYGEYREWRFQRRYARQERQRQEARRLMELNALEVAHTRALLAQLDPHTIAALKHVLREDTLPALREEALALARGEVEETLAKGRERQADELAVYKEQVDAEVERRVESGVQRATEELTADYEDRIRDLKRERTQARQQRDAAEGQLLALLRQVLDEQGRYLRNAHVEEFDQFTINQILKRFGWRVRSKSTYSERVVKTRLDQARWQARAVFWLDTVPAEGVADEADEEGDESRANDQHVIPERLALPEAGEGG